MHAEPTDASSADAAQLELTPAAMRAMGTLTLERVLAHLESLPQQPACGDTGPATAALCRTLREGPPEAGAELESLLTPLFEDWVGRSFTTAGPGYLAFIPGGGLYPSALADLIANATNRFTGVWQAAPALVQLEANVLAWFTEWMGFPRDSTRGLLTSGGSLANFAAIVAAREKLLGVALREGTLYTSSQAHLCIAKAARLAGVLPDRVRVLPVDDNFRLRVVALRAAIDADRRAGLRPFLVATSAGTTNTGAVDPLNEVADLCAAETAAGRPLWHHVDGAYGAFFHMVPELRPLLAGLSRADSLALDPHKGLFLPYGTGAVLVRDGEALRAAHAATAGYLPPPPDAEEFYDPSQYGPELSRDFKGLRVWLPVKLYGTARLRAAIAEKRALALSAAESLARLPGLRLVAPPQLSLLAFHVVRRGPGPADLAWENRATEALVRGVNARQRVMITGCTVDGRFLARVCVLSFRTRAERIAMAVADIAAELAALG
ncbi:MAG: pyridoxal phosphate-dependent decarboxylase family protein [Planctomycetota bacterium]